ncbi:hypothetical protein V474_23010 [Novosphingobium barchaimii LL02]|uniref:Uncharacterized protein n=1 Tax=Novosphingobium barchaimii LL02 TaxID=1114963 RepID=A0A0J7XNV6_9SPHN|nr:hypothetical protein V474_23010 [Novosphingobium barchaimii LL02]
MRLWGSPEDQEPRIESPETVEGDCQRRYIPEFGNGSFKFFNIGIVIFGERDVRWIA